MPSDKTRTSDDIRQGYKGPLMQQGRVILDRDFNALQETLSAAIEADALDIIGPCGTPDDGFAISIPGISSPPDPGLWVPPAPLVAPAPASPTTCSEPMLDAKMDAPMIHQLRLRPARK